MNNSYVMSASFEARKNSQATMITVGFAGLMFLLMFLVRWTIPGIEPPVVETGILVDLNLPDDPPAKVLGGGGGGGNPVQAAGHAGVADPTPPPPGVKEDSKDIETDDNDKSRPEVIKPTNPKPVHNIVENAAVTKTVPKKIETPAPPVAKNLYHGSTNTGTSRGGNEATNYTVKGGDGKGEGVGKDNGTGGGSGNGDGGGHGTGSGTGNGPRRVSGNRVVINPKNMDAGENLKGKVFAEILVSPDGIGSFVRATRGSSYTTGEAIEIIKEWLRRNHFNKTAEESTVVYEFNFLMGG